MLNGISRVVATFIIAVPCHFFADVWTGAIDGERGTRFPVLANYAFQNIFPLISRTTATQPRLLFMTKIGSSSLGIRNSLSSSRCRMSVMKMEVRKNGADSENDRDRDTFGNFIRLVRTGETQFDLQTAVVSYVDPRSEDSFQVDLVSMIHLADADYFNDIINMTKGHCRVLYEMVADSDAMEPDRSRPDLDAAHGPLRHLSRPLRSAPGQTAMAASLGMVAQLDWLDYARPRWFCADLDRASLRGLQRSLGEDAGTQRPALAAMASAAVHGWGRANEEGAAVRGGLSDMIRRWLRLPMWAVPCPEAALLTLDWALSGRGRLSDSLEAMAASLLSFDIKALGKLSFAQLLASGRMRHEGGGGLLSAAPRDADSALIGGRNRVAARAVARARAEGCRRVAVLYGGLHGPDLDLRLREELGLERVEAQWATAWRVRTPGPLPWERLALAAAAYLALDAYDWVAAITSSVASAAGGEWDAVAAGALAYVARHCVLYWQLGRSMVAWDLPLFDAVPAAAALREGRPPTAASPRGPPPNPRAP